MLIVGWGSDVRVLGELLDHEVCENCNNTCPWQIIETSKKASVYFIRVAKWEKRYFCACPVCHRGRELPNREAAQDLLYQAMKERERRRIAGASGN